MIADMHPSCPDFAIGLEGKLLINELMSRHTSWRTGGVADYLYIPANKQDLLRLIRQLPGEIELIWMGLGSNLLVRDGGIRGLVLKTSKGLNQIELRDQVTLYIESGVSSAKAARIAAGNGLTGIEFLAGVPGSFGGALAMNAGAFDGETWDWVRSIECVNRTGRCTQIAAAELNHGYRWLDLPEQNWIVSGELKLQLAKPDYQGRDRIKSLLEKRSQSQPIQSANAGSVFRNPEEGFAAKLIEEAGLKGRRCGDAEVSRIHANFIINRGKATSADIESLIEQIKETVRIKRGVTLEPEVRIIGEH